MKLFLLVGQSNMAGRGNLGDVPEIRDPLCKMLRNGRFQPMREPICFDRPLKGKYHIGVGLATSFAVRAAEYYNEEIGLIPAADGGTSLADWAVGGLLYDHAVMQAKLALRSGGEMAGILWHQGESDSKSPENASTYAARFETIITQMQRDIGCDVPLVMGELGEFLADNQDGGTRSYRYFPIVNEQLHAYAASHPQCAVASAAGLVDNQDQLHFNAASLRIFGERYFEAYRSVIES